MVGTQAGESGGEHGVLELGFGGDLNGFVVESGALVALGEEQFVQDGRVDGAEDGLAVVFERDGDGVVGLFVEEGGGAIDRIDNPAEFIAGMAAGFFAEDGMSRISTLDLVNDKLFDSQVGFGDDIFFVFVAD